MSGLWPSPAEASMLRFLLPLRGLGARFGLAGALFAAGLALWGLAPLPVPAALGLLLAALGHLPLWVHRQTTAPGGATPDHEEIWAPVEDDWMERVSELESRGERWDVSPWDITSLRGFLILFVIALAIAGGAVAFGFAYSVDGAVRVAGAAAVVLAPIWFNGIRTTWNPSELRKKGEALTDARYTIGRLNDGDFDEVPMLALREGSQGKYPVDARLMLRPAAEDDSGFLGIQVQVAMNSVQGTDYPYLYCVVLGKEGFQLPTPDRAKWRGVTERRVVFERGAGDDVVYLVIRQHADKKGGWHTESKHIRGIVEVALGEGRRAWEANRP